MCRSVSATAWKSWDSGQDEHLAQQWQENEFGQADKLSVSRRGADNECREAIMDTLWLSLEVTPSWMIHEVSRFDWLDFYRNRNLNTTALWRFFRQTKSTGSKQSIKIAKQEILLCFVCVLVSQNHLCMLLNTKNCAACHCIFGSLVVTGALNNCVTVSTKGMSHDFRIPVSLFLKGNGNDKALGTVPFFFHLCLFFPSQLIWRAWMFRKSGYFAYFFIIRTSLFTPQSSTVILLQNNVHTWIFEE